MRASAQGSPSPGQAVRTDWPWSMGRWASWRAGWVLAALALWLVATASWRPLMLPDEGRYVGVAWEMLSSGDWLTPTLNGLPYFHKPPLMYWITAAAMRVFGDHVLAMRAAPLVGAWVMGLALWWWLAPPGARTGRRQRAQFALAVLATMPFYFLGGQFANHDMLVAGLVSMAIVAARRALDEGQTQRLAWLLMSWAMAALAVLSKGLIGIVLPALVLVPWLVLQRRWRALATLVHPGGLLVFLAIAAPWFIAMQHAQPGFFDYFVLEQHFRRYTQAHFNNQHPFWFYLLALPALTLPASLWLPGAARRARTAWRRCGIGSDAVLAVWWLVVVLAFFSLPKSKLVGYVLPALPPLAWLLSLALRRAGHRVRAGVLLAGALVGIAAAAGLAWKGPKDHADLGAALAADWSAGDRLALVGEPFFDLQLHARLHDAPAVIEGWRDPRIAREDNWRKELHDAARFAPDLGTGVLWERADAWRQRCLGGRIWLALPGQEVLPPGFDDATRVLAGHRGTLWRVDGPAPGRACE